MYPCNRHPNAKPNISKTYVRLDGKSTTYYKCAECDRIRRGPKEVKPVKQTREQITQEILDSLGVDSVDVYRETTDEEYNDKTPDYETPGRFFKAAR